MAQIVINTGTSPDDKTGTPNRDAWNAVNSMMTELYTDIAATVDSVTYAAAIAGLNAAVTALISDFATCATDTDLALKADLAVVCRDDISAILTPTQKLQFAQNNGLFVAIPFELIIPATSLNGTYTFVLPRFPAQFIMANVDLTAYKYTQSVAGEIEIDSTLYSGGLTGTPIAQMPHIPLGANGKASYTIVGALNLIDNAQELDVSITVTNSDPIYGPFAYGLCLWIRGMWA